ncbi:hypothetical protein MSAN_01719700 [Mycena sanguinolenta]|uniref:Uncharacterized protein n=1 Tax=Mycena sanguinolenta TaxID=230812 RepID=A0A8H7CV21_9AGAR|nr:hypothetical protein MSAN_01719700 [Mycena sanguinolenta]
MAPWSTALANIGQYFQLPYGARGKNSGHKSKLPQTYKPVPLATPFQKYKKQQQISLSSTETASQYFSADSSLSPSDAPPPPLFESAPDAVVPDDVRLPMEFARLRIRGHSRGRRPRAFFTHPAVRRRLEHQRWHDIASVHIPATHVPPSNNAPAAPAPVPIRQSSLIVRQWHGLKQEVEALRADMATYAHIRSNTNPGVDGSTSSAGLRRSPNQRTPPSHSPAQPEPRSWQQYEKRWAAALAEPEDPSDPIPMLRFHDIPWPTTRLPGLPVDESHIRALDVHMFVLGASDLKKLPPDAMARITAEIERWRPQRFVTQVLPRVVPFEQEAVIAAADAVLDILLKARRDIISLPAGRIDHEPL